MGLTVLSEAVILGSTLITGGPNVFLAAVVRSDVISYTEEARVDEGGAALRENELLNAAAQAKADDMAKRGYFSHTGPDGEAPWTWVAKAGYDYTFAGENLAVRFNDSKDVVDAWMASPTHRANIIKPQYKEIGVGIAEGTYKGGPATFVVQFFASPATVAVAAPAPDVSTLPVSQEAVAGAQTSPVPQEVSVAVADVPEPEAPAAPAEVSEAPQVSAPAQAQQVQQSTLRAIGEWFSDSSTGAAWALGLVAALLVVVLALTFFIRIQVQPTDLLVPGAAVALIAITFMGANAKFLPDTQSASVALSQQEGTIGEAASIERTRVAFPEAPSR